MYTRSILDPDITYSTKEQIIYSEENLDVAVSGVNREGGRREKRNITTIRPLFGFKHFKYCLDTNDTPEDLQADGVLYGEALFEI